MKKTLFYLLLLLSPAPMLAQEADSDSATGYETDGHGGEGLIIGPIGNFTLITYTYDAAGNRIQSSNRILPHFGNGNENSGSVFRIGGKAVSLSGSNGSYQLNLSTWESGDKGILGIYNTSGQLITSISITSAETSIDLTSGTDGVYIIYIKVNADSQAFEFVKK